MPSDGELFCDALNAAFALHGVGAIPYGNVSAFTWEDAATEFLQAWHRAHSNAASVRYNTPIPPPSVTLGRAWRDELKKYGRHLPGCPTGAPCNCGFAEIEKELAA